MRRWLAGLVLVLVLGLALAGCGGERTPESTPGGGTAATQTATLRPVAVVSVTAAVTQAAADTATPEVAATSEAPTGTAEPAADTATPEATSTPAPTATPEGCTSDSEFVSDLTVPDGTQFLPGQPIGKQWAVRNNGTCDWDASYRLVLVSGNAMGARSELGLFPARAGANAVIEVGMQAPAEPGTYTGRWQARDPDGNLFGDRIFITIEVINPAPPTDTPAP